MPDIAIQFAFCLDAFNGDVPGGNARQFLLGVVKQEIADIAASIQEANPLYAGIIPKIPVINSICFNGTERLGITLTDNSDGTNQPPAQPTAADNQQILELQGLALRAGTTFSVQITPQGLNRVINEAWTRLTSMNKRVDGDGRPDPKGQVQLNSFSLGLAGNMLLTVNGIFHTDTKTAPDVPFNVISIDNYVIQQVADGTSTKGVVTDMPLMSINPNFSALKAWERGIEAAIGIIAGYFGVVPIEVIQGMVDSQISTSLAGLSLGPSIGSFFQPVFISQVLIPGGDTKLSVSYTSVVTDPLSGILASSTLLPKVSRRNPSVEILGPGVVTQIGSAQRPSAEFSIGLTDIDNPTSVKWSGNATFAPVPGLGIPLKVVATFPYASAKPVYKTISVEVTDDSGLGPFTASLVVMVMIAPVAKPAKPVILQPKRPFPFQL
jgi:hypothetical protein